MRLFLLLNLLILSGCVAQYKPPIEGDTAQLRVIAPGFGGFANMHVFYFPNNDCDKPITFGSITGLVKTNSDIGTDIQAPLDTKDDEYFDRIVKVGEMNVTVFGAFMRQNCSIPISLDLEKNKKYELKYYWSGDKCFVELSNIKNKNGKVEYIPLPVKPPLQACY